MEVSENYMKMEMMAQKIEKASCSSLRNGMLYSYEIGQKTGTKINYSKSFDLKNVDRSKMTDELMKQFKVEKSGTEEFLGKTCEVYTMNNPEMGMTGRDLLCKK